MTSLIKNLKEETTMFLIGQKRSVIRVRQCWRMLCKPLVSIQTFGLGLEQLRDETRPILLSMYRLVNILYPGRRLVQMSSVQQHMYPQNQKPMGVTQASDSYNSYAINISP